MVNPLKGSCLCGDVRIRIEGPSTHASCCHCEECRKASGHYWASTEVSQDHLVIESGQESLSWYPLTKSERAFCVICGTPLFWRRLPDDGLVYVSLGLINGPSGLKMREHIFVKEKGDYYDTPQDAPHFTEDSA